MRAEIQKRTGHSYWAKNRQNDVIIDIEGPLKEYWGSPEREFRVSSPLRPLNGPFISDRETQRPFPLENTTGTYICGSLHTLLSVPSQLRIPARY